MYDPVIHSNLEAFLVAIPLLFLLLAGFFRLDQLFAAPRRRAVALRPSSGIDKHGLPIVCDPDGRRQAVSQPIRK